MDKLQLAHDYFMKHGDSGTPISSVELAWDYVDLMLAEQEKREDKSRPAVLDEFEVDWSQAPEWATHWAFDKNTKAHWYKGSPENDGKEWVMSRICTNYIQAPSFNYTGNWKDSLRERP